MTTDPDFGPMALGAITFRDRSLPTVLDAARAAGFEQIGITVGQCIAALERGIALEGLRSAIEDAGLRVGELELIRLGERGAVRHVNELVEELVGALDPQRVHVAAWEVDPGVVREDFASLCARLSPIPVGYEFMPYNAVPGFAAALDLVAAVDAPNAAIVLDILHFFRSGSTFSELTPAALDRVAVVQLSDVVDRGPHVTLVDEARRRRTFPGRGTLDSVGFLRAIRAAARTPIPLSIEPISDALELLPLRVVADEAMVSTRRLLAASV